MDTICISCRREEERIRYRSKSPAEKQEMFKRINDRTRRRREREEARLQAQIANARAAAAKIRATYGDNTLLPLMPFRLWLLARLRQENSLQEFADSVGYDAAQLARYAEGIWWESDCRPHPVDAITLGTADEILVKAGAEHMLSILYPWEGEE
jgi:predicted Fe-S protein YdhL (DUF1289 family)